MTFIVAVFAIAKYAKDHHVIFNNFNSLFSISIYKRAYLRSTVKKLRSILHYLFSESKQEKGPLHREIDMIENYIGLEKLRYGERLHITFTSEGNFQDLRIVPLILYSFMENAFKHGIRRSGHKGWITVHLTVKIERVLLKIRNSAEANTKDDAASQTGLEDAFS